MPCFIKLSNHVIEAVPKVQLLNHSVILNNVKNLNTFIVCLQILRCSQNDKVKNSAIYLFRTISYGKYNPQNRYNS